MTPIRPIRLVVMDIDGTLLDDEKRLPPENLQALAEASRRGVHLAIASGRMIPSIENQERLLGVDCALIAYNGGKVVGQRRSGRPCISHRPLPLSASSALLRFALENNYLLNFYLDDVLYADRSQEGSPLAAIYSSRTGSIYHFVDLRELEGRQPTKLIMLAEPEERDRLYARFSADLEGKVHVVRTDPEYLEFMAVGVDKGTALPDLVGYFGVAMEEVLAIGDADNDRLMIQTAGLGVAVANAREDIRRAAKHVTTQTNNQGAVAEAIERWVLGR
ncbi:MAG: HAD family phosphatase [Planctomycetes bacterium]|nr:HAD family phosphatase [Planctomycetota bacterium]